MPMTYPAVIVTAPKKDTFHKARQNRPPRKPPGSSPWTKLANPTHGASYQRLTVNKLMSLKATRIPPAMGM